MRFERGKVLHPTAPRLATLNRCPNFAAMPSVLETARLRQRPWEVSDAEALHALWAERDPRSLRVLDAEGRPTVDDLRTNIAG